MMHLHLLLRKGCYCHNEEEGMLAHLFVGVFRVRLRIREVEMLENRV